MKRTIKKLNIAIYYPWIYLTSGIERTILETVKRSTHNYTIFTNHYDRENTYPEFKKLNIVELDNVSVGRGIFSVLKASLIIAFQKIDLRNFDLLLVHSDGLGDLITLRNNPLPVICYCHTPLRPVFDEYYKGEALKHRILPARIPFYILSGLYKLLDQYLWKRYSYIFFNSKETGRRAEKGGLLKQLGNRYEILHPGVNTNKLGLRGIFKKYFLVPGRIMWTKNIELAIKSFISFKKDPKFTNFTLIIAGQVDNKSKPYLGKLKELALNRKDILFVISPEQAKLNKLYSECWATIHTAFNEDFGMTLLESNSFGKPVIAVEAGGYKESQINKETGFLVKPDVLEIAHYMEIIAGDEALTRRMGKLARKNSEKYDWGKFIEVIDRKVDQLSTKNF
jgi:glycosyltransferase involved in cell wall biosynthesis